MIDVNVWLTSQEHSLRAIGEVMGERGLIVVGMGRAGERGFQMIYRFSDACDSLAASGVNVIFVYPKESARHVFDATSIRGARYRGKSCLFLDAQGRFFRSPVHPRSLRAIHVDRELQQRAAADVPLLDETWDKRLRAFFTAVAVPPAQVETHAHH
ncbi:hypothetical protein WKR88_26385 [Trinickia caryophylli]|uniref:hypothetical protein n=1 Tax=Trinickia caryophylli TaxID=28094 RepID=UPI000A163CCF|nr:hypothetical protein [Trinickia caryophylli]PMS09003.1 hypothetical protein C0Z17_27325 [Trinickia caryophylli]TRX15029.1 hypothetical protein FNF07_27910 [Trinickia caryophylli]WQE14886.1 hypothetical protein U0034_20235 [Trinickia caryophylli]GLU35783.1 hypothetical protein Busp01_56250 [Trinickia caryophylli]